ncbi:Organic hydroperoxide resistance protein [Labilithrix luteola]|uniref:Organic hydroperoxide resistance protein n=1 Tax=Labilithrix luteola TaxID=1391654 RepID=A0A0K1PTH3_9BACT|nr:organic hydroperoxide resistance protein [Labilithrix luteola]AKU96812.1 Organic hydroperoxide resistance protein [Labilithrix luteola]
MNVLYTAVATATAGRDGKVSSDDGQLDLALAVPKGLGGPGGAGTNPEQLFAAGYAACFGSALKLVASQQKIVTGPVHITAKVSIGKGDSGFGLAVELEGKMPEIGKEQALELMHAAHGVCPYSNATRGNVEVKLSVA